MYLIFSHCIYIILLMIVISHFMLPLCIIYFSSIFFIINMIYIILEWWTGFTNLWNIMKPDLFIYSTQVHIHKRYSSSIPQNPSNIYQPQWGQLYRSFQSPLTLWKTPHWVKFQLQPSLHASVDALKATNSSCLAPCRSVSHISFPGNKILNHHWDVQL